jgi:hypothetical protein
MIVNAPQLVLTRAVKLAPAATRELGGRRSTCLGFGLGTCWQPDGKAEEDVEDPPPAPHAASAAADRLRASSAPSERERAIGILHIGRAG